MKNLMLVVLLSCNAGKGGSDILWIVPGCLLLCLTVRERGVDYRVPSDPEDEDEMLRARFRAKVAEDRKTLTERIADRKTQKEPIKYKSYNRKR